MFSFEALRRDCMRSENFNGNLKGLPAPGPAYQTIPFMLCILGPINLVFKRNGWHLL